MVKNGMWGYHRRQNLDIEPVKEGVKGLSATECDCWDSTKPTDFADLNASSSGLYVLASDTIPINMANAGADCSSGSIWDIAITARSKAIKQTLTDFLNGVNTRLDQRFAPFKTIGDDYYRSAETVISTANYAGFYIEPYKIKGGSITVNSVDVNFYSGITAATNVTMLTRAWSFIWENNIIGKMMAT